MLHFAEYPGTADTAASYHNRIYTISLKALFGTSGRSHIAVSYNRYVHTWVILDFSYQSPVCLACIHLRAGTSVNGQCRNAAILQLLCQVHYYFMIGIPSQSGFHGDRYFDCIYHGTGYFQHLGDILQHACTGTFACHALHGAAEVDVEYIGVGLLYNARRFHHCFRVPPIYLYGYGALGIADIQFLFGFVDGAYQCVGRYELRIYHICTELLAHQAEGRVGDVLHRGEEYGAWAQVYIFNLHNLSGFVRKSTEKSLPLHTLIQKEMMKHSISDFEIMAPVGSRESLAAAIQAGADSIYFGIENLNMRARSANTFTIDDLREIARTCDEHGMKSYLTVNTIIYDHDIPLMRTIVDAAKAAGISAVIAADVAVMSYARQIGQEVHLSTQLNISNVEALRFYAQFADVVVLARELNLEQVAEIYRHIREENICGPSGEQIRIEMFCHGALCMAVSGKCYLSLHEMNHSANRGACMQVCRRSYTVRDKETNVELEVDNQYIMSPKDLKTIHFMNKMLDAGVRVFKIEGRARGPEYVRTVVECYKEAIRSYLDDTFTDEKIARWDERLKTVFNRGFWDGYYLGQRLGEWTKNYGSAATERKIYVGKGIRYFSNIGVAEFLVEAAEVSVGDKLLITGPTTGAEFVTLDEARVDLKPVQTVKKGQHFSMKSVKIRPSDKLYKLVSVEELKKFKGLDVEKQRG